jgi:hypothetical protein
MTMLRSIARGVTAGAGLLAAAFYATNVYTQAPPDLAPPVVSISSPGVDQIVSGTVTVAAEARDNVGVAGVQFMLDGYPLGAEDTVAPFSVSWDTAPSGSGAHILSIIARDAAGNIGDSDLSPVIVAAGIAPPPPPPPPLPNQSPVAVSDSLAVTSGASVGFTAAFLLSNDSDPDGDPIAITSVGTTPSAGGVVIDNGGGTWTYTPAAGFTGPDSFTYSIADSRGGSASALVNVTVAAAPVVPPPAPAGLVAAFGFDEASGNATDASGNNHVGTIRGATRVAGIHGSALRFDGADDWVTVPDAATLDLTAGMTLEAWINPDVMTGWETVMMKERGADDFAYALYAHDGGSLSGGAPVPSGNVKANGAHRTLRGPSTVPSGTWTHLATTYDGATQRIFVNGTQVASRAQTGAIAVSGGVLRIGGNASFAGEFYAGLIDDVRVYNRALGASEIAGDMGASAPPPPPPPPPPPAGAAGLVLSLDFDEASGNAADGSGSGNAGTVLGATRVAGMRGNALQFDGVDDWVTVADAASLDLTSGMTLQAWVKPGAMTGWETVLLKERGAGDFAYGLYAHDGGAQPGGAPVPSGNVRAGGGHQTLRGSSELPPGVWTHVATTYDGVNQRLFINGVEVASRPQSGLIAVSGGALRIGGNGSFAGEFFEGALDEVRIYNRALTAAEIQAAMTGSM